MTVDEAQILLPLIYQMGDAITDHRWQDALALVDQLLHLVSPAAPCEPDLRSAREVLCQKISLMELTEKQACKWKH